MNIMQSRILCTETVGHFSHLLQKRGRCGCTSRVRLDPKAIGAMKVGQHVWRRPSNFLVKVDRFPIFFAAAEDGYSGLEDEFDEPDNARQAIAYGLKKYEADCPDEALELFNKALTLPGSGVKRDKNKPQEISDGERIAAMYNIACCHSAKEEAREGLLAIAACLEAGYNDFQQLRTDEDLDFLREDPRFDALLKRYERNPEGLLSGFLKGFGRE